MVSIPLYVRDHIDECVVECQRSPEGVRRAVIIAALSAQQPWHRVPGMLLDVQREGLMSSHLFAWKQDTYRWISDDTNLDWLWSALQSDDVIEAMDAVTTVPGLGLAKGGFVVQLATGAVGCIDTHNARRYDVPPAFLRFDKCVSARTKLTKIQTYVDLCNRIGGSEYLWYEWCKLISAKNRRRFPTAKSVSEQHPALMTM